MGKRLLEHSSLLVTFDESGKAQLRLIGAMKIGAAVDHALSLTVTGASR
jgi:hypothetical protein